MFSGVVCATPCTAVSVARVRRLRPALGSRPEAGVEEARVTPKTPFS